MNPPETLALTFCAGCGRTSILTHSIDQFRGVNNCAFCRPERVIQVALYRFERMGTELNGRLLTDGAERKKRERASSASIQKRIEAQTEARAIEEPKTKGELPR